MVDQGLAGLGLAVEPHFMAVQLGDLVTVYSIDDTHYSETTRALSADSASSIDDSGSARDLAWRVGNLPLTTHVVTAAASQPLGRAVGLTVEKSTQTTGHGTTRPPGWHCYLGKHCIRQVSGSPKVVADAMLSHPRTCRERDELFPRIDDITSTAFSSLSTATT